MEEQYQGIVIARSREDVFGDTFFYAPSQRDEYITHTNNELMPDGRRILRSFWFDSPVEQKEIKLKEIILVMELVSKYFNRPFLIS